jgi:hypothetical protein
MLAQYPLTHIAAPAPAPVAVGSFVPGHMYRCVTPNPKAKVGENGLARFTKDAIYMCVANASAATESNDRPPVFLVDNNFRCVNVGRDSKMTTTFIAA